jgi:hypothetical protein
MIGRRLRPNEVRRPSFYRSPGPKSGMGTPRNISPGRVFQLMRYFVPFLFGPCVSLLKESRRSLRKATQNASLHLRLHRCSLNGRTAVGEFPSASLRKLLVASAKLVRTQSVRYALSSER